VNGKNLRDELMYHNRYFPEATIDLDRLESLLSTLTLDGDEVPTQWYRARIQASDTPFTVGEMGAPPRRIASHGRLTRRAFRIFTSVQARDCHIRNSAPHW